MGKRETARQTQGRYKIFAAVYLILRQDAQVLLLKRSNTGWQDGNYSLVSGHIDGNEPFTAALCREAKEEAGMDIRPEDTQFAQVVHRRDKNGGREYIDMFFAVEKWSGEPRNMEPDKCDDLSWHHLDDLPANIIPLVKTVLENYTKGLRYISPAGS